MPGNPSAKSAYVSASAAIGPVVSVVVTISCCLPLGALITSAGVATASSTMLQWRPYLLPISVGILLLAFVQMYRPRRACSIRRPWWSVVLLWFSLVLTVAMIFVPQQIAAFIADHLL